VLLALVNPSTWSALPAPSPPPRATTDSCPFWHIDTPELPVVVVVGVGDERGVGVVALVVVVERLAVVEDVPELPPQAASTMVMAAKDPIVKTRRIVPSYQLPPITSRSHPRPTRSPRHR
jgi:hypothetical protein